MLYRFAFVILLFTILSSVTRAQAIHPVPGSGAGYIYFPGEDDARAVLKIVKETAGGLDTNYEVHLTFENDPQELLCSDLDPDCEKTLGAGTVKLEIKGEWIPGKAWLAKHGKFSGACSGISTACQFNLQGGGTHTVRIKVGCNAHDYSVINLGGGDQALCVTESHGWIPSSNNGKLLVVANKKITSGKKPRNKSKQEWGAWSWEDGQDNSNILMNNWSGDAGDSATHYCDSLNLGAGQGKLIEWYLPAYYELYEALKGWVDEDFIIPKGSGSSNGGGYFSSSEDGKLEVLAIEWSSGSARNKKFYDYKKSGSTLCMHAISP